MQTINSQTLFEIPLGKKLKIKSRDLFTAAVLPKYADNEMVNEILNNALPTNNYTSLNMPNSESVCVVKPYNTSPITIETQYIPASNGMRSVGNYMPALNGMRNNNNMIRTMYADTNASFMDKLKAWWAQIPSWAKWVALALMIAIIGMIIYMVWRRYGGNMMKTSMTKPMNTIRQGMSNMTGLSFF